MNRASDSLRNFSGANPFAESQARDYLENKAVREFFPTNVFRSLFNEQNEILVGTRGSGKTILLRMLSYSCIRKIKDDAQLMAIAEARNFIGFYVPLHLEFVNRLKKDPENSLQYFSFSLNCSAADALLFELKALLDDCISDRYERLEKEHLLVKDLSAAWLPDTAISATTIDGLRWEINLVYLRTAAWTDTDEANIPVFARSVLSPIKNVLGRITQTLGLNEGSTQWIACIDEAEFIPEAYIKAINTFMRSEKRPLTLKMATLPYKHSTRDTLQPGEKAEPNGNDFNYRPIDYDPDSDDFVRLTNHIVRVRLERCGIGSASLEEFLGIAGKDDGLDYFREELGAENATSEALLGQIRNELPPGREKRFDELRQESKVMEQQYLKKYSPVLYVRVMKREESKGNRTVGWFAGARVTRRVSEGNPRRFLQLMNEFFQSAIGKELTFKNQHRIVTGFCNRERESVSHLPRDGLVAKVLIDLIGDLLGRKVHGPYLSEGGCDFSITQPLLDYDVIRNAVGTAVAYSHIVVETGGDSEITEHTRLRLSFLHAVCFWLPMRKGDPVPKLKPSVVKDVLARHTPREARAEELAAREIAQMSFELDVAEEAEP